MTCELSPSKILANFVPFRKLLIGKIATASQRHGERRKSNRVTVGQWDSRTIGQGDFHGGMTLDAWGK